MAPNHSYLLDNNWNYNSNDNSDRQVWYPVSSIQSSYPNYACSHTGQDDGLLCTMGSNSLC